MKAAPVSLEIYCDGACLGNPGPGGWAAILLLPDRVVELAGASPRTTNNAMEIHAAAAGLHWVAQNPGAGVSSVLIQTDSSYVIQGATQWVQGWKKKNWITREGSPVANQERWVDLDSIMGKLQQGGVQISWRHVPGHSGIPGNERADQLARASAEGHPIPPFEGSRADYEPIVDSSEKGAFPRYLSYVRNKVEHHATWAECEARVKGVSGARYKKVLSPQEERETMRAWGLSRPESS